MKKNVVFAVGVIGALAGVLDAVMEIKASGHKIHLRQVEIRLTSLSLRYAHVSDDMTSLIEDDEEENTRLISVLRNELSEIRKEYVILVHERNELYKKLGILSRGNEDKKLCNWLESYDDLSLSVDCLKEGV